MRPWYDMAVKKRGRTTFGVSGLDLDTIGDFICTFLGGGVPENPRQDISLTYTLNLATDDIKAYYCEGITAQPGQFPLDGAQCPASRMSPFKTEAGNMAYSTQTLGRMMEPNANAALEHRVLFIRSGADLALLDARPPEFAKVSMNDLEQN